MVASLAPADLGDDGKMIGLRPGREPRQHLMTARQPMVDGQAQRPGRKDGQLGCQLAMLSNPVLARKARWTRLHGAS